MQIEKINPRIITYKLAPDENDKEYRTCMWAKYIFDCDNGRFTVNSDVGDYSYCWGYNDHEDFMHFMTRVNAGYLLDKISSRTVFNVSKSKTLIIENIKKYGTGFYELENYQQINTAVKNIAAIYNGVNEETFFRTVSEIVPTMNYESIDIVKEYPHGAIAVVELFIKYLQPEIKKNFTDLVMKGDSHV